QSGKSTEYVFHSLHPRIALHQGGGAFHCFHQISAGIDNGFLRQIRAFEFITVSGLGGMEGENNLFPGMQRRAGNGNTLADGELILTHEGWFLKNGRFLCASRLKSASIQDNSYGKSRRVGRTLLP